MWSPYVYYSLCKINQWVSNTCTLANENFSRTTYEVPRLQSSDAGERNSGFWFSLLNLISISLHYTVSMHSQSRWSMIYKIMLVWYPGDIEMSVECLHDIFTDTFTLLLLHLDFLLIWYKLESYEYKGISTCISPSWHKKKGNTSAQYLLTYAWYLNNCTLISIHACLCFINE